MIKISRINKDTGSSCNACLELPVFKVEIGCKGATQSFLLCGKCLSKLSSGIGIIQDNTDSIEYKDREREINHG